MTEGVVCVIFGSTAGAIWVANFREPVILMCGKYVVQHACERDLNVLSLQPSTATASQPLTDFGRFEINAAVVKAVKFRLKGRKIRVERL